MRGQRVDAALYGQAFAVYARNVGVLLPPLVAAAVALGLEYAQGPLFAPIGGAGDPLIAYLIYLLYGFAFAMSVIFADDAWRHGRASLVSAWNEARRKAGSILIAVIGFLFLLWVAQMIGGFIGGPILGLALGALALWAFIYSIPAAAIGGVPGGAAFSASLQAAKRQPLATAVLVVVSIVVWFGLSVYALAHAGPFLGAGYDVARLLLTSIAIGYIALVVARQYGDLAFRPYW